MLICFVGPKTQRRLVEEFEWSRATGFRQEVPADMAFRLITDPAGEFVVDAEEPLLQLPGLDAEMAGRLAMAEIGTAVELAEVPARNVARLARDVSVAARQVRAWIDGAADLPEVEVGAGTLERRG